MPSSLTPQSQDGLDGAPRLSPPRWLSIISLAGAIVGSIMLLAVLSPRFLLIPAIPCLWLFCVSLLRARRRFVRRMRLEGELHVLHALRTVTGAVDSVEPTQIAETFLSSCCRTTSAAKALLLLIDDATFTALIMGDYPRGSTESAIGSRFSLDPAVPGNLVAGPIGQAIKSRESIVSPDVNSSVEFVHWRDISMGGIQVTIPIIVDRQAIGCVLLWFKESGEIPGNCDVAQVVVQAAAPMLAKLRPEAVNTDQATAAQPDMQLSLMDLIP